MPDVGLQVDVDARATTGTGVKITSNAAGSGADIEAISTGANENLNLDAKGTGEVHLAATSTGNVVANRHVALGVSAGGAGSTFVPLVPIAAQQDLSGPGAVNITTFCTKLTTTGADAFTLANGAVIGQLKKVQMIVDGGDGVLTPANLAGGTTITFADAGDFALLAWDGTDWVAIELGNDADGATAPVLA
jgi:hypothetical protein